MYAVFGLRKMLFFIAALIVLVIVVSLAYKTPADLWAFGRTAWKVASGVVTAVILLGSIPWVFRIFWWFYESIVSDAYPNISGTWVGTVESNYPIHQAIRDAAISTGNTLDPLNPSQISPIPLQPFNATLTIKASLLKINIIMEVEGLTDKSQSFSVAASPQVATSGEAHRLAYIYKSSHHNKAADDEASHTGAAEVTLRKRVDGKLEMVGLYWTARNWRRAGNTAGILNFVRQN